MNRFLLVSQLALLATACGQHSQSNLTQHTRENFPSQALKVDCVASAPFDSSGTTIEYRLDGFVSDSDRSELLTLDYEGVRLRVAQKRTDGTERVWLGKATIKFEKNTEDGSFVYLVEGTSWPLRLTFKPLLKDAPLPTGLNTLSVEQTLGGSRVIKSTQSLCRFASPF